MSRFVGWPGLRKVRSRLALSYAGLFFVAGAVLLSLTYGLVTHSLPKPGPTSSFDKAQLAKLSAACKQRNAQRALGSQPGGAAASGACAKAFALGANVAAGDQRTRTLRDLLVFSILGLGALTVASGGLGWWMAARALRPVAVLTGAARRASEENLSERIALQGPHDELKELADTFDQMLDRLDATFSSQRRFVADAAHELRTPLTVMRTAIDVTTAKPSPSPEQLQEMVAKLRRSVDQAERLVEALLTLATSEQGVIEFEPIDLATAAEDALDAAAREARNRGLRIDATLESAPTSGQRTLIERLVANLIDNAVRHNLANGWVNVRTSLCDDGAVVEVSNSGPVIPEAQVDSLFEPFRRMERTAGGGVGVGLAIVRSVASVHRANIRAVSRTDGGLVISVAFPVNK